jgi:hypothetical protein
METKQTAVDWIESKLNSVKPTDFCSLQDVKDWVKEAKQMEKEQMIKFAMHLHDVDMSKTGTDILMDEAEQYYNETYDK